MYMPVSFDHGLKPTQDTYDALQSAYDHFNWALFDGKLPNCLITLQRRARTYGYFSKKKFRRRDGEQTDEIALNPAHFGSPPVPGILATLAHEMTHLWQAYFGVPGRGRYHNKEWAMTMKAMGLHPSRTGKEGEAITGDTMSQYVVSGGRFERSAKELVAKGFEIAWMENRQATATVESAETKSGKRTKYRCPSCGLNAWAKHGAELVCGEDMNPLLPS